MKILDKEIGDGNPCYITLEAGPTHNGINSAIKLVDLAAESGADAIKFQIFDPDTLVADRSLPFTYDILLDRETGLVETVSEPLYDILCRRCLTEEEWLKVKSHCDGHGLAFFSTVTDDCTFSIIEKLNLPSYKIASSDINHHPLIRKVAKLGQSVQLDTGNATLGEIEAAVDVIKSEGNDNIIIHNCPSGYPARLQSINLNLIKTIKQLFQCPAAFSDHSPGWDMDIAALALGANLIEKTITLDKTTPSVEHIMSLEPSEIKKFVRTIRDVEVAMGSGRRVLTNEEKDKRIAYRRSIYTTAAAKKGDRLSSLKVEFRRPGFGLSPIGYEESQSMVLKRDVAANECIQSTDLEPA